MENSIICMMPLGDGQTIHSEVLKAIGNQTIPIHLMSLSRPIEHFDYNGMDPVFLKKIRTNRKSISITRNLVKSLAVEKSDKYVLHLDSDVVFTSNHDVEDMVKFLDENPKVAIVGLNTKNMKMNKLDLSHVSMACLLFRKEILNSYIFHNGKYDRDCNCQMLTNDIRKLQFQNDDFWEIRYLDYRQLYEIDRL